MSDDFTFDFICPSDDVFPPTTSTTTTNMEGFDFLGVAGGDFADATPFLSGDGDEAASGNFFASWGGDDEDGGGDAASEIPHNSNSALHPSDLGASNFDTRIRLVGALPGTPMPTPQHHQAAAVVPPQPILKEVQQQPERPPTFLQQPGMMPPSPHPHPRGSAVAASSPLPQHQQQPSSLIQSSSSSTGKKYLPANVSHLPVPLPATAGGGQTKRPRSVSDMTEAEVEGHPIGRERGDMSPTSHRSIAAARSMADGMDSAETTAAGVRLSFNTSAASATTFGGGNSSFLVLPAADASPAIDLTPIPHHAAAPRRPSSSVALVRASGTGSGAPALTNLAADLHSRRLTLLSDVDTLLAEVESGESSSNNISSNNMSSNCCDKGGLDPAAFEAQVQHLLRVGKEVSEKSGEAVANLVLVSMKMLQVLGPNPALGRLLGPEFEDTPTLFALPMLLAQLKHGQATTNNIQQRPKVIANGPQALLSAA